MAKDYGKSGQKANQRDCSDGGSRLASAGRQGEGDGNEIENGATQGNCTGVHRNTESPVNRGTTNFGKILSQLRELQRSHLAYVEAHEERLKARLKAAKEHHDKVLDQMKLLEQEILELLGETA
jgi:hypothetical protein